MPVQYTGVYSVGLADKGNLWYKIAWHSMTKRVSKNSIVMQDSLQYISVLKLEPQGQYNLASAMLCLRTLQDLL
jgi:hypothetical protein